MRCRTQVVQQGPCPLVPVTYLLGPNASVVAEQLAQAEAAPGHDVVLDCELLDMGGEGAGEERANPPVQLPIGSCANVRNIVSNVQLSSAEVVSALMPWLVATSDAWQKQQGAVPPPALVYHAVRIWPPGGPHAVSMRSL